MHPTSWLSFRLILLAYIFAFLLDAIRFLVISIWEWIFQYRLCVNYLFQHYAVNCEENIAGIYRDCNCLIFVTIYFLFRSSRPKLSELYTEFNKKKTFIENHSHRLIYYLNAKQTKANHANIYIAIWTSIANVDVIEYYVVYEHNFPMLTLWHH